MTVMFGSAFDMRSQNPVFGLVVALIVLGILDLMYAWRTSVLKVVLSAGVIIIGLLWDFMLSVGQTQRLMNVGIVTLGMCVTYYYLHSRENTMVFTAAIFGAACVLTAWLGCGGAPLPQRQARLYTPVDALGVLPGLPDYARALRGDRHGELICRKAAAGI